MTEPDELLQDANCRNYDCGKAMLTAYWKSYELSFTMVPP